MTTESPNAESPNAEGQHAGPRNASDASPTKLGRLLHGARAAIDDGLFGPPLFWTWNFVFIAFTVLGFAPVVLVDMLRAARVADVATPMAVWGMALVLIPVLSVGIALRFLRDRPQALYAFFYGVEAPLMLIAAVRLFILRDLPAHAAMLYTAALIGLAALAFEILFGRKESAPRAVLAARVAGLTVLTITGIYVAAWVAFLAAPVAWMYLDFVGEALEGIAYAFRRGTWASLADAPFGELFFALLGAPLLIFTASLFIASPVLVPALYVRRWRHAASSLAARTSRTLPAGIAVAVAVAVVWIGIYAVAARQPQHAAFAMFRKPSNDAGLRHLAFTKTAQVPRRGSPCCAPYTTSTSDGPTAPPPHSASSSSRSTISPSGSSIAWIFPSDPVGCPRARPPHDSTLDRVVTMPPLTACRHGSVRGPRSLTFSGAIAYAGRAQIAPQLGHGVVGSHAKLHRKVSSSSGGRIEPCHERRRPTAGCPWVKRRRREWVNYRWRLRLRGITLLAQCAEPVKGAVDDAIRGIARACPRCRTNVRISCSCPGGPDGWLGSDGGPDGARSQSPSLLRARRWHCCSSRGSPAVVLPSAFPI